MSEVSNWVKFFAEWIIWCCDEGFDDVIEGRKIYVD
jgi:hypothetical protein